MVVEADTLTVNDSIIEQTEPQYGILLTAPAREIEGTPRLGDNLGVSFILCGLFVLFLVIALRYRNNIKYVSAMFRNLIETRTRQNVFDDTVRETSLIVMLNILWCCCAGIVIYSVYGFLHPGEEIGIARPIGMLLGIALCGIYAIFMWGAYAMVGWIFSDRSHSELWVKGYSASQALMAPALFVTALVGICRPQIGFEVGMVSAGVFILAKLIFIWKGYRIFFNQISSWVLFLCYLCSLEIVPLILCYRIADLLGKVL